MLEYDVNVDTVDTYSTFLSNRNHPFAESTKTDEDPTALQTTRGPCLSSKHSLSTCAAKAPSTRLRELRNEHGSTAATNP